jgi:hypothetical protein
MKRFLITAALVATTAAPVFAADVGVSVSIGQPGFYGQIDIGNFPQPQVIYPQPMIIMRTQTVRPPIYLRVPPGHAKHWRKHCREYNACNRRVFFVKDDWYEREYAPRYREHERDRQTGRSNESRNDDRGNGNGKKNKADRGKGKDKD